MQMVCGNLEIRLAGCPKCHGTHENPESWCWEGGQDMHLVCPVTGVSFRMKSVSPNAITDLVPGRRTA